jgi:hypothetical protein
MESKKRGHEVSRRSSSPIQSIRGKMTVLDPPEPIRPSLRRKNQSGGYASILITGTMVVLNPPEPIRPSLRRKKKDR